MAALQKRQEKILRQLLELKEQMSKIKANLNGSTQKFNSCTNGTVKTEVLSQILLYTFLMFLVLFFLSSLSNNQNFYYA